MQIAVLFLNFSDFIKIYFSLSLYLIRQKKNNISVVDLSEESRPIPNPVLTFEDAYTDFRKSFSNFYTTFHISFLCRIIRQ